MVGPAQKKLQLHVRYFASRVSVRGNNTYNNEIAKPEKSETGLEIVLFCTF